jgi:hypothetical protein
VANRYWIGTGNWDATNTANWSVSSGGAGGASVPTLADAVFFDAGSAGGTCTITAVANCAGLTCTGFTGTLAGSSQINCFGDFTLVTGMTYTRTGVTSFGGTGTRNVITAGKTLNAIVCTATNVNFNDNVVSIATYQQSLGTVTLNGNFTFQNTTFSGTGVKVFNANNAIITLTATGTVWTYSGSNLTFNRGTSKIVLSNTTTTARTFAGGGLTYYDLEIGGATGVSTLTITGSSTFNTISSTKTVAHTVRLTAGTTTTVTNWNINGSSGNQFTLNSATAGSQATLAKAGGGTVSVNYTTVTDIVGTPTSTWSALTSNGCVDGGNNTGWTFSGGGTVYNVALSEAGTATDTQTVVLTVTSVIAESVSATDSQIASLDINPYITESVSATDSQIASLDINPYITESGSATDSVTATGSISIVVDVSETVAGTDTQTVSQIVLNTLTESVTVGDNYNAAGSTYNTQVSETLTVQDVVSSVLVIVSLLSESLLVTETQAEALDVVANIAESITAVDTQESVLSLVAELVAVVTANDTYDAGGSVYTVDLTEAGDAQSTLQVGGIFNVTVLEALNASDSVAGRLLWELINDIQNANWNTVVNVQTPGWVSISNTQNPNWTPINTFGTS